MTYSLVSAAAVGFDLVRLPSGPNVADVLLRGLAAGTAEMQALANVHPGPCRTGCWQQARERLGHPAAQPSAAGTPGSAPPVDLTAAGASPRELLTRLVAAPLGNLDALDRMIRHDILDWTWEQAGTVSVQRLRDRLAADVLVDAAASAYCANALDDELRRHLAAPFLTAGRSAAPDGATEPAAAPDLTTQMLDDVATWTTQQRSEWVAAVDLLRDGSGAWTGAMHDAGWAAHLSGRTRTAAEVQLRGVLAFRQAGFTVAQAAQGAWNALSGVLQALTVEDLLGDAETRKLLAPWNLATGGRLGPQ